MLVLAAVAGWTAALVLAAALGLAVHRSRIRRELTARACHELRGPLTAAELALHGLGRRGVPVGPVQGELARARLALADLAAAPAGSRGPDRPGTVDLAALLARHEAAWGALAAASGASLEVRRPRARVRAVVHGDPGRIAQAVANLVANAAEHAGGRVRVAIRATRGTVAVEVRDDGPGLPAPVAELVARPRGRPRCPRSRPGHRGGRRHPARRSPRGSTERPGRAAAPRPAGRGPRRRHRSRPSRPRRQRSRHPPRRRRPLLRALAPVAHRAGRFPGGPPPGGPVTRGRRAAVLTVLALLLGGLAAADVAGRERALRRQLGPSVPVLVTREPVRAGRPLRPEVLAVRQGAGRYAPADAFGGPVEVAGLTARGDLAAGTDLVPALTDDGRDDAAIGAPVRPGERVAELVARGSPALVTPGSASTCS
jgi:hypothetical protein